MTTVPSGTRIGPYEVITLVGAGGMGEVYRARDSRLDREVALKVLPDAFARDPERMARFEREAKVLASLNHPNIASIYGLEESGNRRALVLELVAGPTLADRIRQGPVPLDEALPLAGQVAEGLEYAHERDIIHRDLKPANVKLTRDGQVKVLDFGLAKALAGPATEEGTQNSPTLSVIATGTGVLLGTAAYMAPEQARGKTVDRRADIWAFGCMFYEMLTGSGAFCGETTSDILASVIRAEPDWSALPASVPSCIRELLRRCLQKDPKQRLQAIGDARIIIEETLACKSPNALLPAASATEPDRGAHRRGGPLPWTLAAALAATLIIAVATGHWRPAPGPAIPLRASILPPENYQFRSYEFALSPDGRKIAFVAYGPPDQRDRLWIRSLDSTSAQVLEGTVDASNPFWSPDSTSIGFFAGDTLKRVDASGGPVITLAAAPMARGGTWGRDGNVVFAPQLGGHGLSQVPSAGGAVSSLGDLDPAGAHENHRWPVFLPDGRSLLFYAIGQPGAAETKAPDNPEGVYVLDLSTKSQRFLLKTDSQAEFSDGYLFFVREGNLMAQRFDPSSLSVSGEALPVADEVRYQSNRMRGAFSTSSGSMLAYTGETAGASVLEWFTRDGRDAGRVGAPARFSEVSLSPDGTKAATSIVESPGPRRSIWIYDAARGTASRLTTEAAQAAHPVWNENGTKVFYGDLDTRQAGMYSMSSNGLGGSDFIDPLQGESAPNSFSPDGASLLYMSFISGSPLLWIHPLAPDHKDYPLPLSKFLSGEGQFSPDGRWLAYVCADSGRLEVYIVSFPGLTNRVQISTVGGSQPRWRRDGKELYYIAPNADLMAAPVTASGDSMRAGIPTRLFPTRIVSVAYDFEQYDVTPDGQKFLINTQLGQSTHPITIYENWKSALRRN